MKTCGECVVLNDTGDGLIGACPWQGYRARVEAACADFFPLDQVRAPPYGSKHGKGFFQLVRDAVAAAA